MVSISHLFKTFLLIMISYKFTLCHGDQTQEKECETLDLALNIRESKKETFNYYKLPNDKMIYDETNQYLSFYPIEKSTIYNTLELSPLSNFSIDYTIRVFDRPTSDNLDENETPLEILKLKEPQKNDDIFEKHILNHMEKYRIFQICLPKTILTEYSPNHGHMSFQQ